MLCFLNRKTYTEQNSERLHFAMLKESFFFVIFYLLFTVENDFENSRQNIHRQNWLNGCFGEVFFFVGARYDTKCSLTLAMLYFTHLQPFYMDRFLDFSTRLHCARWPFSFSNQNNFHAFGTLWYYKSEHIFNKHTNCKLTFGIISTHIQTYTKKTFIFLAFFIICLKIGWNACFIKFGCRCSFHGLLLYYKALKFRWNFIQISIW